MQLGMIGLGRMGGNIVRRLTRNGHHGVVFDRNVTAIKALVGDRISGSTDPRQLVGQLDKPRIVWLMLPAGPTTEETVGSLSSLLEPEDAPISWSTLDASCSWRWALGRTAPENCRSIRREAQGRPRRMRFCRRMADGGA